MTTAIRGKNSRSISQSRRDRRGPAARVTLADSTVWLVESLERRIQFSGSLPTVPVPAAHWTFDEGSGITAADSSGNGHTGTLGSGASWTPGNVGAHAISLNGSSAGVITVPGPVINTAGSFTASAWVDLASLSGYQTFVSIAGTNVAGFFLQLRGDTGTFSFARLNADSTAAGTNVAAPTAPLANTWYHLVGVDDASAGTLTLYVDGQSMGSVPYTTGWEASGNTLIGHGFYKGAQVDFVDGSIDDVELFSSALSAAQVAALDQPAAYPFDDGTGTAAVDSSGHGHTLQLNSGAAWTSGYIGSNALAVNGTAGGNATYTGPVLNTAFSFSVSAWVNLNSVTGYQTLASIDGVNTSGFYLQLRGDTGKFAFTRLASDSDAAQAYHADAANAPVAGVWYNLIGVNNTAAKQLQLFVNGVLQSTVSYGGGWQASGATVVGGGLFNGARTDFVSGKIDDVHFFDSPLSASEASYIGTNGSSTITVSTATTGATVSPDLFGAFMEDINYGGEGGVYNDEVRNSGFNDSTNPLNAWAAVAGAGVQDALTPDSTTGPTNALTESGKLAITSGVGPGNRAGISNAGYFGVAVAPSTSYSVQLAIKATAGFSGPVTVDLESTTGTVYASATVSGISTAWNQHTVTLATGVNTPTTATNLLVVSTDSTTANGATIWFGATYLFPPSYENAANHLRIDLMQKLAALKPAIFRVPGGNYLEGNNYATRFEWSNTIGPVQDRPGHYNSAWGYWSTDGMGLDEYLQMADEVGASPILAVYAGYTLGGTSDTGTTLNNDVTDAVNELHYVLDPVTTSWGAERAANGHPAPYDVSYVEVGNEDFFSTTYAARYPLFYNAIHSAFPQLQLIATTSSTGGSPFDVLDEHFYNSPQWFEANSGYFNSTARGTYKIFIGEYASNQGAPTNDLESALGDSAWLLGLERNSDLVTMSSYAPLWINTEGGQWTPDLIGFDNTTSYGSPSYYAQLMLSQNHGSNVIGDTVSGASGLQTLVTRTGDTYYLTVINTLATANDATINMAGVSTVSSSASVITLAGSSSSSTNSISNPTAVTPNSSTAEGLGLSFNYDFAGESITILKFTADNAPTVAVAAAATPLPVTGTTANLSVLGADGAGEKDLTYSWSAAGPAAVSYSANGSNTAKNTAVTFTRSGSYTFTATITNSLGLSITSAVTVTVDSTLTLNSAVYNDSIIPGGTMAIQAADQFGSPVSPGTWSVNGGGTINSDGLFTAGSAAGSFTVTATSGGSTATLGITVVPISFSGPTGGDTYAIRISPVHSGVEQIFVDQPETSAPTYSISLSLLPKLTFAPAGGDGTLTVDDANGEPLPLGGVFYTGGPNPTASGNTLIIAGAASGSLSFGVDSTQVWDYAAAASPIVYRSLQKIVINLAGGSNQLNQTGQPGAAVVYNAGPGANTLNVSSGTFTFSTDPEVTDGALTVNDDAAILFAAPPVGSGIAVRHLSMLNVGSGAVAALANSGTHTDRVLLVLDKLAIAQSGHLNLGANDAQLSSVSLSAASVYLAQGFHGGDWQGNGIVSSLAAASSNHLTAVGVLVNSNDGRVIYGSTGGLGLFDGVSPGSSDVLLKYTYYGDANLDGQVDGSDYTLIDNGYNNHLTGWQNGDFNYDGVIDGSDYTLIDNAFNVQSAALTATIAAEGKPATASPFESSTSRRTAISAPKKPVSSSGAAHTLVSILVDQPDSIGQTDSSPSLFSQVEFEMGSND